ncbi:MAG: ABC transporter permease [Candidatus Eisenbacteria bacterium]|nr:ABC transporter permease [Candidatus Eisenbacteria bacterium]
MGKLLWLLRKDLLRRFRSPAGTLIAPSFPLGIIIIMGLVFRPHAGRSSLPAVEVALVNEDTGFLSRLLMGAISQDRGDARLSVHMAESYDEGLKLVRRDKVSGLLRIPPGFTDSLMQQQPTHLDVVKNPSQSIMPQVIEEGAGVLAVYLTAGSRLLAEPIMRIREASTTDSLPSDLLVSDISQQINQRIRGASNVIFPPILSVSKDTLAAASEGSGGGYSPFAMMLPGFAIMGLLFLSELGLADLLRESQTGTLRRLRTAPFASGWIILSKLILSVIIAFLGFIILMISASLVLNVTWGSPLAILTVGFATALAATGIIAPLYGILRSERQAGLISTFVILAMSFVGGSFWPREMMPPSFQLLSPFTLNHWALEGFRALLRGDSIGAALGASLPVLLPVACAGWILGVFILRRLIERRA